LLLDLFHCLSCNSRDIQVGDREWLCLACGKTYLVQEGIPLLVSNWETHKSEIEQAKSILPNWYLMEQPPENSSPWRHHLRKRRLYVETTIKNFLNQSNTKQIENLLDLGCGDGNHLAYLSKYAAHLFGSDYNLVRLSRAHKRFPDVFLFLADLLNYPISKESFDILFFNHVLEHIHEDEKALQIAFNLLKPGGLLILGIPNEGEWWWQLAYKLDPITLKTTDHVQFYTLKTISKKILSTGFTIKESKYLGWGPPNWKLDSRIRKYKIIDDGFEKIGKIVIPHQASSLYIIALKPK
jgi:SAM-dependent methyltransferase